MFRRRRFAHLFVVLAVVLTVLCTGFPAGAASTYTDPQGHFSFTVPNGWQQAAPPTGTSLPAGTQFAVAFTVPTLNTNNFAANVNIVTTTVPAGTTLAQVVSAGLAALPQSAPGYQAGTGGVQNVTLGGQPAAAYQFTLAPSGQSVDVAQVVSLMGTAVYIVTFTAAPADFAALQQQGSTLLSTFQFTGAGAAPAAATPTALPSPTPSGPVPAAPAAPTAPAATTTPAVPAATALPAAPKTGGGGNAAYARRLGDD